MTSLDKALLAAHAAGDTVELVRLYSQAARDANDDAARDFFLTHAHVYALETDHPDTQSLRQELVRRGREEPLHPALPPRR